MRLKQLAPYIQQYCLQSEVALQETVQAPDNVYIEKMTHVVETVVLNLVKAHLLLTVSELVKGR